MRINFSRLLLTTAIGLAVISGTAFAQLGPNQTAGFGAGKVLTFTYAQSFDCIDQPNFDLNFNGILAQIDPMEFQIPICQVGTENTIDPTGKAIKKTKHIYVLIPMFSHDNDQNPADAISCDEVVAGTTCGPALGTFLISAFGAVPEAFKITPLVSTQCPEPGLPAGTCTMHTSRVDLAPALAALGKIPSPPAANVFVPTPNHSHVIDNNEVNEKSIWWEVRPVLVLQESDWPAADGSSGITSVKQMDAVEQAGNAIEVPSNFFLFFSSKKN